MEHTGYEHEDFIIQTPVLREEEGERRLTPEQTQVGLGARLAETPKYNFSYFVAIFADNFGPICRQFMNISIQFYLTVENVHLA